MDRFGGLIREPFGGVVDVAAGVWQSQVHVRCFDGERVDDQSAVGFGDAIAKRLGDGGHHFIGKLHWRMGHAFGGHPLANWIAGVQCVRFVEADLIVPGGGPGSAVFAGQPEAVRGFDEVIADGSRHGGRLSVGEFSV